MKWLAFIISAVSAFGQLPGGVRSPASMVQYQAFTSNQVFALSPKMWFMADVGCYSNAGLNLCVNGMSVQRWTDCSGNGWDVGQTASEARKPIWTNGVLNGHAAVIFVGTSTKVLTNPCTTLLYMPNTVFFVGKSTNTVFTTIRRWWDSIQIGFQNQCYVENTTGNGAIYQSTSAGVSIDVCGTAPFAWFCMMLTYQTNFALRVIDHGPVFVSKPNGWVNAHRGLSLGASYIPDQPGTIQFAEFIWFNDMLNEYNRNGVQLYLLKKYNLPGNRWN